MNRACCGTVVRERGGTALVGTCQIKYAKQPGQVLTIDVAVHGSTQRERLLGQLDRTTTHGQIQLARDSQHRIAHRFEFQATPVHPPVEHVLRINRLAFGATQARLLIGVG